MHSPRLQHLRHGRQTHQQTSQHQAARQHICTRSLGRADSRSTRSSRGGAVAAAATAAGGLGRGKRSRGGCVGAGAGAGALLVLADDKVDNLVAVAVDVQVVDGQVAAGVAVDVALVAVRDDAAGVLFALVDTGRASVEELSIAESATRLSISVRIINSNLRRPLRWCLYRTSDWRHGLGLRKWQWQRLGTRESSVSFFSSFSVSPQLLLGAQPMMEKLELTAVHDLVRHGLVVNERLAGATADGIRRDLRALFPRYESDQPMLTSEAVTASLL